MTQFSYLSLFLSQSTDFEILIRIPECPEESECSENLDLEAIIGEEVHEGQESEIGGEGESATRASREDRSDDTSDCSYARLVVEVLSMSELESLIEDPDEKEGESKDHYSWKENIRIGV